MVMPIIVHAARNLFAPSELSAIAMISLNRIIRIGVMRQGNCRGTIFAAVFFHWRPRLLPYNSNVPLLLHSYGNVVTGSYIYALIASLNPLFSPVQSVT